MKTILILGGGFAGVSAARELLKSIPPDYGVTLVNKSSRFTFKPLLHEVATGAFADEIACEDIPSSFRHPRFSFVEGTASSIDLKKRFVSVKGRKFPYDYILIALGSQPNFFGIPGAEKHSLPLGSAADAFAIKKALVLVSEKEKPRIMIVGGGALGIELSTEVAEFMDQLNRSRLIVVINRDAEILPGIAENLRNRIEMALLKRRVHLLQGTSVSKVSKGFITTDKKDKIPADMIIWAAGVKPAPLKISPKLNLLRGCFAVDESLHIAGFTNAFVAGDCAACMQNNVFVPQLAQSAVQEGRAAAKNILASIKGQPMQRFEFNDLGFILPLGKGYAVASIKGITLSGFFAWWVNRTVYMLNMLTFRHKLFVVWRWTLGLFRRRNPN